jgi:hypothetical protein
VEIYIFGEKEGREKANAVLKEAVDSKHLIPILGTGFSSGTITRMGKVPNVRQLKNKMAELLLETSAYHGQRKEDFEEINLFQIAGAFWDEAEKLSEQKMYNKFVEYMENNFTNTNDLPIIKRKFLNAGWRYIYTLNYDDAIERNLEIETIIPYNRHNKEFIERHFCLFKLHGDAKEFVKSKDKKYCILSKPQYLESLNASENYDMCKHLETDFTANSLLFIGCGLSDELDLLFAAENGLRKKSSLNSEMNSENSHLIYLLYKDNDETTVTLADKLKLQEYGITDVLVVNREKGMNDFYQMVNALCMELKAIKQEDELENYKGIHFRKLNEDDQRNLDYFFINEKVSINNGTICLPGFFVERSLGREVIREIHGEKVIHVIAGSKLSGKTYLLLQLVKELPPGSTYYLPIAINDRVLSDIKKKQDCIFVMDKSALTIEQVKSLFMDIENIKKKNIKIILVVNSDDKDFLEFYSNKNIGNRLVAFHLLPNKFAKDTGEIADFNKHIAKLRLVDYKPQNTILDFLFQVEESIITNKYPRILPPIKFLGNDNHAELKAMIILAVENVIPLSLAVRLGIEDTLFKLSQLYNITVQKDYLTDIESEVDFSRFKFVNNSPYWVLRCLSECARNVANHDTIANAYYSVVNVFLQIYQNDTRAFNSHIKKYFMLDMLQTLFSNNETKGILKLPNAIYEKLHNKLFDHYQFLHQEAKCELRVARREKKRDEILAILGKAFGNINRALDLGEKSHAENIEYTLNHMKVTKALVLSNYLLIGKMEDKINETIGIYYETFVNESSLLEDNFLKNDDLKDVNNFMNYVLKNCNRIDLTVESKERFGEIYFIRNGKHISF